jgi:hypothetical protein
MQMAAAGVPSGVSSPLPTGTILSSFPSPSSSPSGLTYDGTNLISCDYDTDTIYIHDGVSSTILSSFSSPGQVPNGLTYDGTNLISCDHFADRIYVHDGVSSTILSSFSSPGPIPSGLAYDGTNLISCDNNTDTIYIHDGVSSTILSSFATPTVQPKGLTYDGTNLISCVSDTDFHVIYIHDGVSSTILSSFTTPDLLPVGLAYDGTNLISCDNLDNRIYTHTNVGDSPRLNLNFYESAYGAQIGSTDVYVVNSSGVIQGAAVYSRAAGNSGTPDWSSVTAATPVISGTFRIAWHYVSGSSFRGDYAVDTVTIQGVDYNFDINNNGFLTTSGIDTASSGTALSNSATVPTANSASLGRWNRHTGSPPSSPTGPTGAQGGSYYLYTETSLPNTPSINMWLFSPEITV